MADDLTICIGSNVTIQGARMSNCNHVQIVGSHVTIRDCVIVPSDRAGVDR